MPRVVVRIRPAEVMDDLDLGAVSERVDGLSGWEVEVRDTRLTDATYVTVVAERDDVTDEAVAALQKALSDLPRMRAMLWRRSEQEVPLESADAETVRAAATDDGP